MYKLCVLVICLLALPISNCSPTLVQQLKLARTYLEEKQYPQAIHYYQEVLKEKPDNPHALFELGLCFFCLDQLHDACTSFQHATTRVPHQVKLWYNLAHTARLTNQNKLAIDAYRHVLSLSPDHEEAHFGLAKAYLAHGDFEQGWQEFEWRYHDVAIFKQKKIDTTALKGKTVLLRSEWGFGDIMQFVRYAKLLKDAGAHITLEAPLALHAILSTCPFIDTIIPVGTRAPITDVHIPLLSLPYIYDTRYDTIPAPIPYFTIPQHLIDTWKEKIPSTTYNIGICWHAKPIFLEEHITTRRSLPLTAFEPLANLAHVRLYSLQKIHGVEELATATNTFVVHDFGPDIDTVHGSFMDTAAIMHHLDLVISADTSIVHLAGALGIKTWVLLPYTAEWRWLEEQTTTPWYPNSMRLFRQQEPGNWDSVIREVCSTLTKELDNLTFKE